MALRPAPLESLSFPARVLLLGTGIVLVCTISLIVALLLTGITPLQEAWAGPGVEHRRFVLVTGAGLWIFLLGSAVWAFWRQGWKPWGSSSGSICVVQGTELAGDFRYGARNSRYMVGICRSKCVLGTAHTIVHIHPFLRYGNVSDAHRAV